MKKILISLLIVLLLALCIIAATKGLPFGIPSIGNIIENNELIDSSILQATTLASTDYDNVQKEIEKDIKKLQEEKKRYDDLTAISTGSEVQAANHYQKYEIEYLWTIVGNHAKSEGVVIKMDLASGTGDNVYNLNFTVTGSYIGISDFISDIENDSALGFKIENFSLLPGASTDTLKATFVCKDITIRDLANSTKSTTNNDTQTTNNTTSQDATNTTNNTTNNSNNTNGNTQNGNTSNTTNNSNTTANGNTTNNETSNSSSTNNSSTSGSVGINEEELTKLDR